VQSETDLGNFASASSAGDYERDSASALASALASAEEKQRSPKLFLSTKLLSLGI
jgi:hypothetical protein